MKRRWVVDFDIPKHGGRARQERPHRHVDDRREQRLISVPPLCGRTRSFGINGLVISHKPSGTIQLHVPAP